ncbi:MAG: type II secretion system protein [Holophagales bacterium]|nr:type II secretion system protein [Holophagales bacterium]
MTVRGPRKGRSGYTLVALLIGITVASILIAAVLPLASAQAQRDREAELIFRGLQYAEGIRIFRRRFGRYPTSLRELLDVKPRSIRKAWKDPMAKDGEWESSRSSGPR